MKCGALATPVGVDWDGDGDDDIVSGNTAGYIQFYENLGPGDGGMPKWAAPRRLAAGGQTIRIQAGPNGSIQGPCEAKWGYTTLSVADWNHDGVLDLVVNSILGEVVWYQGMTSKAATSGRGPELKAAQPIQVEWPADRSQACLDLVAAHRQATGHPVADDAGRGRLHRRWARRPG